MMLAWCAILKGPWWRGKGLTWGHMRCAERSSCSARAVLFMRAYSQPMPSSGRCRPGNSLAAVLYAAIACAMVIS